jgi:hypothetical protein
MGSSMPAMIAGHRQVPVISRLSLHDHAAQGLEIEPTRIYKVDDARAFLEGSGLNVESVATAIEGKFMGAFVRGRKPIQ